MRHLNKVYNNFQKSTNIQKQAGFGRFLHKGLRNVIGPATTIANPRVDSLMKGLASSGSNLPRPNIQGGLNNLLYTAGRNPLKAMAAVPAAGAGGMTGLEGLHNSMFLDPNANMNEYLANRSPFDWIPGEFMSANTAENRGKIQKAIKDSQGFLDFGRGNSKKNFDALHSATKGLDNEQLGNYMDNVKDSLGGAVQSRLGDEGWLNTLRYWLSKYLTGPIGLDSYATDLNTDISQNIDLANILNSARYQ